MQVDLHTLQSKELAAILLTSVRCTYLLSTTEQIVSSVANKRTQANRDRTLADFNLLIYLNTILETDATPDRFPNGQEKETYLLNTFRH